MSAAGQARRRSPSSNLTANSIAAIRRKYAESSGWRTPGAICAACPEIFAIAVERRAEDVAVVQLRAAAEVAHRVAQLRLDDRVDDDRGPALRAVDHQAQVVDGLDPRVPDLLERLLGELGLERGDEPRRGLPGGVGDDVQLYRRQLARHLIHALRWIGDTFTMRILVVDDERAVREALERALRLEGYEVELAEDGQRGAAGARRARAPTRSCSTS